MAVSVMLGGVPRKRLISAKDGTMQFARASAVEWLMGRAVRTTAIATGFGKHSEAREKPGRTLAMVGDRGP